MDFLKNLNFSEINLKDDVDQVRALALLIDKPLLFIDPISKAKQILLRIFKDLQVVRYDQKDKILNDRPILFENFNYKKDLNPIFQDKKIFL